MDRVTIKCASCGRQWLAATPFSLYEQQAVESCPCPHCGAYTLCCREAMELAPSPHWQGQGVTKRPALHAH